MVLKRLRAWMYGMMLMDSWAFAVRHLLEASVYKGASTLSIGSNGMFYYKHCM